MDWQTLITLVAVVIAGVALLAKLLDKNLTIREHEEYKQSTIKQTEDLRDDFRREIDRLQEQLKGIENTRPTTNELKITADHVKEQIAEIRSRLNNLK